MCTGRVFGQFSKSYAVSVFNICLIYSLRVLLSVSCKHTYTHIHTHALWHIQLLLMEPQYNLSSILIFWLLKIASVFNRALLHFNQASSTHQWGTVKWALQHLRGPAELPSFSEEGPNPLGQLRRQKTLSLCNLQKEINVAMSNEFHCIWIMLCNLKLRSWVRSKAK